MPRGYPPEFRAEAVELYRAGGRSLRSISESLGISIEALRQWIRQADIDDGRTEGLTTTEREEFNRLRRENRILKEEREILKKAAAFFATEGTGRTR